MNVLVSGREYQSVGLQYKPPTKHPAGSLHWKEDTAQKEAPSLGQNTNHLCKTGPSASCTLSRLNLLKGMGPVHEVQIQVIQFQICKCFS